MKTVIISALAGLIFGLGLTISQMINPAKIIGFLDLFGHWDPSLAFVMAGALVVSFVGYRIVLSRSAPFLVDQFHLPAAQQIDGKLMAGASLFGIGWGLSGLCPGPAISALFVGGTPLIIFVAAMLTGMLTNRLIMRR